MKRFDLKAEDLIARLERINWGILFEVYLQFSSKKERKINRGLHNDRLIKAPSCVWFSCREAQQVSLCSVCSCLSSHFSSFISLLWHASSTKFQLSRAIKQIIITLPRFFFCYSNPMRENFLVGWVVRNERWLIRDSNCICLETRKRSEDLFLRIVNRLLRPKIGIGSFLASFLALLSERLGSSQWRQHFLVAMKIDEWEFVVNLLNIW